MAQPWWERACPVIHNAGGCRQTWPWEDPSRVLNDHELFLVGRGFQGSIIADGRTMDITGPGWALVPPGVAHICRGEQSGAHRRWVHFDWDAARGAMGPLFSYDQPPYAPDATLSPPWAPTHAASGRLAGEELIREHIRLTAAWERGGASGTVRARSLLLEILVHIVAPRREPDLEQRGRVLAERVRSRLDQIAILPAVRTPPLPEALAGLGHGADHLARHFRAVFGIPPVRYLQESRVSRACALLRAGQRLTAVAEELGYLDTDYLSRLIRRRSGQTASWHRSQANAG